jgi:hypothetical protein
MSEENQFSQPPPGDENKRFPKIIWLFVALCPSLLGFAFFRLRMAGQFALAILVIVDLICSVAAAAGLVRGIKSAAAQAFFRLFLGGFFFVLNGLMVLFVGCSGV